MFRSARAPIVLRHRQKRTIVEKFSVTLRPHMFIDRYATSSISPPPPAIALDFHCSRALRAPTMFSISGIMTGFDYRFLLDTGIRDIRLGATARPWRFDRPNVRVYAHQDNGNAVGEGRFTFTK